MISFHQEYTTITLGWFSNRTGTSFDDGKAHGKDWTRLPAPNLPLCHWSSQLFDLRAQSSTDVPILLLNQPINSVTYLTPKIINGCLQLFSAFDGFLVLPTKKKMLFNSGVYSYILGSVLSQTLTTKSTFFSIKYWRMNRRAMMDDPDNGLAIVWKETMSI